ncbi:MAG: radical SAM protein, partial [Anaerolineae bacterium]|nr:radical SAM protein [Anaerolineae bacterium]
MANENPQRPNVEFYEDVKNLRKPLAGHDPLNLHLMAQSGDLYETLEGGKIHCYACGHHCKISPGGRGICQVRYNLNGTLYVPWGYVAALQCDPTEKKPFYHLYPGSDTLTFGMLGCDLHCSYCFTGDTPVVTNRGVMRFDELFDSAKRVDLRPDGEIASIDGLQAVAESGQWQNVRAIFKHPYQGQLAVIKPYYLPEIKCTADHQLYATDSATVRPQPIMAKELTSKHYLAIPKNYSFSKPQIIDVQKEIGSHQITYQVTWDIPTTDIQFILDATAQGMSSKQIGQVLGKNPSYIRHIRSKIGRGRYNLERTQGAIIENNLLRFPNERRPGIPTQIPLDENLARLLGYYCAEGSVITGKERPNSHSICFAFALDEIELANEVKNLILTCFGIEAAIVTRETTLAVQFSKSSIALLLKKLVGGSAVEKHIPEPLFDAPRPIVEAFIDAYAAGDGHLYENGKYSITTVSKQLAYDIAWLTLKLGNPPSLYVKEMPSKGLIVGREVNFSPYQFTVVWYKD